jgi:hypothetical protein
LGNELLVGYLPEDFNFLPGVIPQQGIFPIPAAFFTPLR